MNDFETGRAGAAYWALRATYGLVPIAAGADKFLNLLTDWTRYLSPSIQGLLPVSPQAFMGVVGVIEIAAGLLVFTRFTREAAYVVSAWLLLIAVNLLLAGAYDVAVRDVVMAVGAFSLARLEEARRAGARAPTAAAARTAAAAP